MSCTTYCMYCILGMSSWGWDTISVGGTSRVSYHIGHVETNFIFFLAPSETQNNKIISMSMATSPASPPNHRDSINDTNPPHDDYDDDNSPPALRDVRAVRLSYEASPTSKVRKALSHATPPTGGRCPRRRSRRMGEGVLLAVEFAPIIN